MASCGDTVAEISFRQETGRTAVHNISTIGRQTGFITRKDDTMDEPNRMYRSAPWIPWAITSLVLVLVAIIAYSLGAQREAIAVAAEPARRVWFFGGFPGFWLFFALIWMLGGFRRMWWGYHPGRRWRYERYYYPRYSEERDDWEEWHRRAHDRTDSPGARGTSTSSATDRGPIT
jgi:hypothetical protein